MTFAVIETGGKQYLVSPGDKIKIEKIDKKEGETVEFDQILLVKKDEDLKIGTPKVEDAKVVGEVLEQGKEDKVVVFKYKPKKRHRKKKGHRQPYTKVEIKEVKF